MTENQKIEKQKQKEINELKVKNSYICLYCDVPKKILKTIHEQIKKFMD